MRIFLVIFLCIALFSIVACDRNEINYGDTEYVSARDAVVKLNYASLYPDNRYVFIKFNGKRVTPLIRGRQPFPGGGYNTYGDVRADFLSIKPGNVKVEVVLPHSKDNGLDSVLLYSTDVVLDAGKRYTVHIADTGKLTRSVMSEEDFSMPDSGYARYRFINLMPNVPEIDLYYGQSATVVTADKKVASAIKFMEISDYITLNRASARTWKIRPAGAAVTNATVLASYTSASTLLNQRTYTIYALGYNGVKVAPTMPYLSFFHIR